MKTRKKEMVDMVKKILKVSETLSKLPISGYYEGMLGGDNEYEVQIGSSWFRIDGQEFYVPYLQKKMSRVEREYKKSLAIHQVLESFGIEKEVEA